MSKKMFFVFGVLLVLITACQPAATVPSPDIVINDVMDAWNSGDVVTLKALFADNASVCFPDWGEECTIGKDAVGAWIEGLVVANFIIEPESLEANGDKVTVVAKVWADPTRELGIAPLVTTDVYTVQNGKITSQTSTLTEESSTKLMSAMAAQAPPPSSVVSTFESALNAGDIEAAFVLFADDAQVTFVPSDTYTGAEEIHAWLEQLIAYHFEIEYEILEEEDEVLKARTTSWSDFSRQLDVAPLVADELYIIQDGEIMELTITLTEESAVKLQAALTNTVEVTPTSIQEIVDVWEGKVLPKKAYYHFREDGALFVAYTFDKLHNDPISLVPAQYWFEGETFHIEDDCGHGTYLLTLTMEDDRRRKLSFQLIDDTCEQRIADFETPMRYMRPY